MMAPVVDNVNAVILLKYATIGLLIVFWGSLGVQTALPKCLLRLITDIGLFNNNVSDSNNWIPCYAIGLDLTGMPCP